MLWSAPRIPARIVLDLKIIKKKLDVLQDVETSKNVNSSKRGPSV